MFESVNTHTDGRTTARLVYYKLKAQVRKEGLNSLTSSGSPFLNHLTLALGSLTKHSSVPRSSQLNV